jgi:hypothetical protein
MIRVGKWKKKEKWKFDWLTNEGKIKILGFTFMPDMKRTIKLNMKACIDKIRNTVAKTENRILTELQKHIHSPENHQCDQSHTFKQNGKV